MAWLCCPLRITDRLALQLAVVQTGRKVCMRTNGPKTLMFGRGVFKG